MTYNDCLDIAIISVSGVMIFSVAAVGIMCLPWKDDELVATTTALDNLWRHIKQWLGM